jgi:ABC-type transporter Mla subunit MlaD
MTVVIRYLFALMLGALIGAGGTIYVIQSDAGNLLVRRTDVVQDLERRLRGMEQQRDQLNRQLEDVVARSGRMEQAFDDLEHKFKTLDEERPAAKASPKPETAPEPKD